MHHHELGEELGDGEPEKYILLHSIIRSTHSITCLYVKASTSHLHELFRREFFGKKLATYRKMS